jgi:hypothetical protein
VPAWATKKLRRALFALTWQHDVRQLSSALHASMESAQTESALRASAAPDGSGPRPGEQQQEGAAAAGASSRDEEDEAPIVTGRAHWAAAAGSSGAGAMRPEDFPALPGECSGSPWLCHKECSSHAHDGARALHIGMHYSLQML